MGSRDLLRASRIHRTGLRFRFRGCVWGRVLGKGIVPFTDRSPRCRGGLEIHPAKLQGVGASARNTLMRPRRYRMGMRVYEYEFPRRPLLRARDTLMQSS